jgi:hypothetical protein
VTVTNPFNALLEQQRSEEQRKALHRLRDELGLRNDDALWHFVSLIEQHFASCRAGQASMAPARTTLLVPTWVWICVGMAAQTLVAAVCVAIGLHARPTAVMCWEPATRSGTWLRSALALPAGWIAFLLAVPAAGFVVRLGWRLRKAGEVAWGYTVLGLGAGCFIASALALWKLL